MSRNEMEMWKTNIENTPCKVAAEYSSTIVNSVSKYEAAGFTI